MIIYSVDEPQKTHWLLFVLPVLAGLLIFGGYQYLTLREARPQTVIAENSPADKTSDVAAPAAPQPPAVDPAKIAVMQQQINAVIARHPAMDTSVSITYLKTGESYHYGETRPFIGASITKLLTATLYLHQVETGQRSLGTYVGELTAQQQLQQLIVYSDNDAWDSFNTLLGSKALTSWAKNNGLNSYDFNSNVISTDDVASLLAKLYEGKLLNQSNTALLLSYLKIANKTDFIATSVPDGVTVYHKAGWLDDRENDAAIIDDGEHPYVLVIFNKQDLINTVAASDIFNTVTKATLTVFNDD